MAEAAASLQKERAEDEGKEATDEAAAAGEGHVSGGPVEKQSFFGKIKTGFSESVKAAKRLQATYLPGKDLGDKDDEKEEERPQTATKTATSDEDGTADAPFFWPWHRALCACSEAAQPPQVLSGNQAKSSSCGPMQPMWWKSSNRAFTPITTFIL